MATGKQLFWKAVGTEALVACLKGIPVAGPAVEFLDKTQQRYSLLQAESRVQRYGEQVIEQVQDALEDLLVTTSKYNIKPADLERTIERLNAVKSSGFQPAIFDALIANGSHRDAFLTNPTLYGRVLEPGDKLNPSAIQLVVDLDGPRVVEVPPFVLATVFGTKADLSAETHIVNHGDVWAVKERLVRHANYAHYTSSKAYVVHAISEEFDSGRTYSESEVDEIIKRKLRKIPLTDTNDPRFETTHLRRALIDLGLMTRNPSGTVYRK